MANDADVDVRQELLRRIRTHQASIKAYVRKMQGRHELWSISVLLVVLSLQLWWLVQLWVVRHSRKL